MNKVWLCLLSAIALGASAVAARAQTGVLLDYGFHEGSGNVVHDSSGNGYNAVVFGGASWVRGLPFGALSFNGKDGYVEGPADLPIGASGTVEFWCYPRKFGGGLISWCSDGSQRLSLKFDVLRSNRLEGDLSDGQHSDYILGDDLPADVLNRWSLMALRFDPRSVDIFRNGQLQVSRPTFFSPNIKDSKMRFGATPYRVGIRYFDGMMADVEVYNPALPDDEIAAQFAYQAPMFQSYLPRTLTIVPRFDPILRELTASADLSGLTDLLLSGYSVEAQLLWDGKLLRTAKMILRGPEQTANLTFSGDDLTVADYEIECTVRDLKGAPVVASSVRWRMPKLGRSGTRVLNNLVAELLDAKNVPAQPIAKMKFTNPRQGWVFASCKAALKGTEEIKVAVEGGAPGAAIDLRAPGSPYGETMCYLPEGPGALKVECAGKPIINEIVVRSIPELLACRYPLENPPEGAVLHRGTGDYDFNFLQKGVLPNINTIVGGYGIVTVARMQGNDAQRTQAWFDKWNQFDRWKQMGRRWLQELVNPNLRAGYPYTTTADQVLGYWSKSEGFTDPNYSGLIADELFTSQGFNVPDIPTYVETRYQLPPYTAAIRKIAADPQLRDRRVYIWCGANDRALAPHAKEFVNAVMDANCKFVWEEYMSQPPTERDGIEILSSGPSGWGVNNVRLKMERASALFPGIVEDTIFQPGLYSIAGWSHQVDPNLDLKVWMDMEMQYLATAPEFFGLDGISWYPMSFADEETLRWAGQLFRHYAIEGKTDLLSAHYGYTWRPNIIQNADFESALQYWTIKPATPDRIRAGEIEDLGLMEGRFRRNEMGRHFVMMVRSDTRPNVISQIMRNLVPGRLYSVKMLCTDYYSYLRGVPGPPLNAHIFFDGGVQLIPDKCFVTRFKSISGPKWFDSFRLVFRARNPTAMLNISDWKTDKIKGGPYNQAQIFNFVAVTPYFE